MSTAMLSPEKYLRLATGVSIKILEQPYIYDATTDELYEINEEASEFLVNCDGSRKAGELCYDEDFLEYCIEEYLIDLLDDPSPRMVDIFRGPVPSLRYLELQITWRCNKACKHCYLGRPRKIDMPADMVIDALEQFEKMGGLRVMISGGEPLLHPEWELINSEMARFEIRRVLLSNGELINEEISEKLNVHEVQVSVDGMEKGHNFLRGRGSWKKAMKGAINITNAKKELSIATMVHKYNLDEFEDMNWFFREMKVQEWNIDLPCAAGNMDKNDDITPPLEEAAEAMKYAYGGGYHGGGEGYICGHHLVTVTPRGEILKCGFYPKDLMGTLEDGLEKAWLKARHPEITEIECVSCDYSFECGGGCRFRAPTPTAPDPVMCVLFGGGPEKR